MNLARSISAWFQSVGAAVDEANRLMSAPHHRDDADLACHDQSDRQRCSYDCSECPKPARRLGIYHFCAPLFMAGSEPGIVVSAHNFLVRSI